MSGLPDDLDPPDCYDEEEEDLLEECGLGDDGQCSMAGSEHCDFSCKWRNSELFAGNPGFKPKRKRKAATIKGKG